MSLPTSGSERDAPCGARTDASLAALADEGFDVADLIGQASASLDALARAAGLALVCQVSSAPLRTHGERQRCREELLDLVRAAAVPQGGSGEIRIAVAIDGAHVEVEVTRSVAGREHRVGALRLPSCPRALDDAAPDAWP